MEESPRRNNLRTALGGILMVTTQSETAQAVQLQLVASRDCLECQLCYVRGELDRVPPTEEYQCLSGAVVTDDSAFDVQTGELIAALTERPCGRRYWESARSGDLFTYLLNTRAD